jgi:hypothetical protein
VAGAVLMIAVFFVAALAIGFIDEKILHLNTTYDLATRAVEFSAAGGVLIGGVFGAFLPLVAVHEGEARMHEKILASALTIAMVFLLWRLDSDTVFASGWRGLSIIATGVLLLAAVSAMFSRGKA